ncbi:MAG: HNH endonuclease [Sedimentisphaerales bacterium]
MSKKDAIVDSAKIACEWVEGVGVDSLRRKYETGYDTIHNILLSRLTKKEFDRIRRLHLSRAGKEYRWQPGHKMWNKGTHFCAGGRSAETRFKPGQIRGNAAQKYRHIGFISVRYHKSKLNGEKHGRRRKVPSQWIKIKDDGRPRDRWIQYARYIYEKTYGPIPRGFFPIHADKDTMNDDPNNLILIDRAGNLRRNGHSPEVRLYAHARAVEHRKQNTLIRKLSNGHEFQRPARFECFQCGWSSDSRPPLDRCPKCGSGITEQSKVKVA